MNIKFDSTPLAAYPTEFSVTILDIDDGETSVRTSDATMTRDRVAVKRQIQAKWGLLKPSEISSILQSISKVFFDVYYPDPMTGSYETKTFYAGNRPSTFTVEINGVLYWSGLSVTLTEK